MKISYGTRIGNINDTNGYGYATVNMLRSLARLGYEVNTNDPTADVEIWFDQPHRWDFSSGPYRIGYHPWESTKMDPEWVEDMNQCDEIWTPSPIIADWYKRYTGIKPPVYVYEHGVDPIWRPEDRTVDGTFKFLHSGAESLRKGGSETMAALRSAFPKNEDVSLTMKVISDGWNLPSFGRVNVIYRTLSLQDLIQLYHDHHVYVYPSWGEGFGLTPLQAMATGMPTITVPAWAPYATFLDPNLCVDSELVDSPWSLHPGKMLRPDFDSLVDAMRYSYHNYDEVVKRSQDIVPSLLNRYNWDNLTQTAFENLRGRLENS
jgi:glycosyltransferase involved in cell wall biosynthesis